jgi:hypothetical protein
VTVTIKARSNASADLPVGDVWVIDVRVTDADGCYTSDTVTVTVTLPAGGTATPTVSDLGSGRYRAEYTVGSTGRYVARVVGSVYGATDFTAYVSATVAGTAMPDITDLDAYLKTNSYTDDELQDALDAEAAAQRRACKVPAAYSADLRRALLRRAARALALMRINLDTEVDGETGRLVVPPGLDREIRRYEAPYRRLGVG